MPKVLLCPSVTPPSRDADELQFWLDRAARDGQPILALATRENEDARLDYAGEVAVPAPASLAQLQAGQPLRLAGACAGRNCLFFADDRCELAASVARHLPPAPDEKLPKCAIRARCRWFEQGGAPACARCPEVHNRARATPLARHIHHEALANARRAREEN